MATANDLKKTPKIDIITPSLAPELPVKAVSEKLSAETGNKLQLNTRANPKLVSAVAFGHVYVHRFHSSYVAGRLDEVMRLAVSMGGLGRQEQIDLVRAGGAVPDAYFNPEGKKDKREYGYLKNDEVSE